MVSHNYIISQAVRLEIEIYIQPEWRNINVQYEHFFIGVNYPYFDNSSVYSKQYDFNNCGNNFEEKCSP